MQTCPNCFQNTYAAGVCGACGWSGGDGRSQTPHALPVGTVLKDRYVLGRLLGAGGFGITYYACDVASGDVCAIKEYFPAHIARRTAGGTVDTSAASREEFDYGCRHFRDEAQLLLALNGVRAVVHVRDYFHEKQTAYMVMEYLSGENMKQYKQHVASVPAQRVVDVFTDLCLTLTEVHARGLLHRDISPQNIILQPDGSLRLIDFGAARYVMGERSKSLSILLKKGYAPPEQYSSHGHQGPWTDLYSLGATIYFFATGQMVPDAMDRMEADTLTPLIRLRPDLGAGFCGLVQNCLMLDWRRRRKSADEVLEILLGAQRTAPKQRRGAPASAPTAAAARRTLSDKLFGYPLVQLQRAGAPAQALDVPHGEARGLRTDGRGGFVECGAKEPACDVVLRHAGRSITLCLAAGRQGRMDTGMLLRPGVEYSMPPGSGMQVGGSRLRIIREG